MLISNYAKQVAIVVPCFNEEEALPLTLLSLQKMLQGLIDANKISKNSVICFVDDGSSDNTWNLICNYAKEFQNISGVKLSRNRGHQNALLAGIFSIEADAVITIDADLQDDVNAISKMIDRHYLGADIVYGVRSARVSDSWFKRITAQWFYKIMKYFGVETVYNHADYRLMSRRAIEALKEFGEVNLYLRGIIPLLGFKTDIVYYDRAERVAGESKYPINKMLAFALQAITSFSVVPLRVVSIVGVLVFLISVILGIWVLFLKIFTERAIPGWTSIVLPMLFLGGIQIFSTGIIGEYLGKAYIETKKRPRYFIDETIGLGK